MELKANETMTIDVNAPELKISEEYLYSLTRNGLIHNTRTKIQLHGKSKYANYMIDKLWQREMMQIGSWFSPSKQEKMCRQSSSNFARCCTCNEYTKNCMCEERNNKYRNKQKEFKIEDKK